MKSEKVFMNLCSEIDVLDSFRKHPSYASEGLLRQMADLYPQVIDKFLNE